MTSTRAHLRFALLSALGIAALYLGLLHFCADAVVADGYDGVGFILSLSAFDLGRFQPQPPGYPLFVLAGRLLHFVGFSPKIALILTSSLLLAAGLGALAAWVRAVAGWRTALLFLLLVPTAPLTFGLGMATLSDGAGGNATATVNVTVTDRVPVAQACHILHQDVAALFAQRFFRSVS